MKKNYYKPLNEAFGGVGYATSGTNGMQGIGSQSQPYVEYRILPLDHSNEQRNRVEKAPCQIHTGMLVSGICPNDYQEHSGYIKRIYTLDNATVSWVYILDNKTREMLRLYPDTVNKIENKKVKQVNESSSWIDSIEDETEDSSVYAADNTEGIKWLEENVQDYNPEQLTYNGDNSYNYNGDIRIISKDLPAGKKSFASIGIKFGKVYGRIMIEGCNIESLEGFPEEVDSIILKNTKVFSLKYCPKKLKGLSVINSPIQNLIGIPTDGCIQDMLLKNLDNFDISLGFPDFVDVLFISDFIDVSKIRDSIRELHIL